MSQVDSPNPVLDIVFVGINYGPEPTGIAPYTQGMAEALRREGHRVRVITAYPSYPAWEVPHGYSGITRHETIRDVEVARLRTVVPSDPTPVRRVVMESLFGIRAAWEAPSSADVVICVSPALFSSAIVGARLRAMSGSRRPAFVMWVQDLYGIGLSEIGTGGDRAAALVSRLERSVLRRVDGVAVIHQHFADHLISKGVAEDRIRVVPNWSHITRAEDSVVSTLRERLGWSESETVILHAGNMGAKQGLESVIDAARLATNAGRPYRFILLGDGNRRKALEAHSLGCESVEFLDPVSDAEFAAFLSASDILLLNELPSIAEMCVPSKLTSYFAAGRPVLAATNPYGVSASVIDESGAGVVVTPGDPQALLEGVDRLASDSNYRHSLGERGRAYCQTMMGEARAHRLFADWIRELVPR